MPVFERYIGIDYSGAATPQTRLTGLRVFSAIGRRKAGEIFPDPTTKRFWNRRDLAFWLTSELQSEIPTLVGIDHGFSFPLSYFDENGIQHQWPQFLDDFERHWPTNKDGTFVEDVRRGFVGNAKERLGKARWRRITDIEARAKSVFHFDVPGSVAKSTHAGLPWLAYIRRAVGPQLHFWPFDGWRIPKGASVIAEVYPSLWSKSFNRTLPTQDQHDAFTIAAALARADRQGELTTWFAPPLKPAEKTVAAIEGWILGVSPKPSSATPMPKTKAAKRT